MDNLIKLVIEAERKAMPLRVNRQRRCRRALMRSDQRVGDLEEGLDHAPELAYATTK